MERGDRVIALTVLITLSVIGVIATTVTLSGPTGHVSQSSTVYPTYDASQFGIWCQNPENKIVLIGSDRQFIGFDRQVQTFCCPEDMIGQNSCKFPRQVMLH